MEHQIIDDAYTSVLDDIQKIQTKPTMYISYTGSRAFLHLIREMINNVFDEYKNENDISDGVVTIFFDSSENMIYISDTGRGIPFDQMYNTCTILHSGTKMRREHGDTAGENGCGLTATNALSEVFELTTYRDGQMKMLQFREGRLINDTTAPVKDKNKHGLLVGFKPSTIFLGKCKLDVAELDEWLTEITMLKDPRIKIKFTQNKAGKEASSTKVYQNGKDGFGGFLAKLDPEANLLRVPIILKEDSTIMEYDIPIRRDDGSVDLIDIERSIGLTVVINFNPASTETTKFSFCNDIKQVEHGEHTNGVLSAIIQFFRKKVKANSKKDIEVTNNDIISGLSIALSMTTDYSTGLFTGQTKFKMDNKDFYEPVKKMTLKGLEEYFKNPDNKRVLMQITTFINDNIKARQAATKVKKKAASRKSFLEGMSIFTGLIQPNRIKDQDAKLEIYIVEGDSAGSNAIDGRFDPDIQGVLKLQGKPTNIYELTDWKKLASVSEEMRQFFDDILGCGYGDHFDITKLIYDKIILCPDSDIDGDHITGLMVANIYKFARPLIDEGKVYRVITPLYALEPAKKTNSDKIDPKLFLHSKGEYFGAYQNRVTDVYKIKIHTDSDFVSKEKIKRFLETNADYYDLITNMASHDTVHPAIIEYIAQHPDDFRQTISSEFKEIEYHEKDDSIVGIYDGSFYALMITDEFMSQIQYLSHVIQVGNGGISHYHIYRTLKTKGEDEYLGCRSIYEIMSLCKDLEPAIKSRIKGQGEMSPKEFYHLVMDPNNRLLYRITANDEEICTSKLDDLFLKTQAYRNKRKKLIEETEISVDDIDN